MTLALAAELEKLSAAASPPISYRSTVVLEAAAAIRRLHTDLQLAYAQRDQEARTHVAAEAGLVEEAREARRERDEALILLLLKEKKMKSLFLSYPRLFTKE